MPSASRSRAALAIATVLLVVALVALLHAPDVARGWHEDDHGFLRLDEHRPAELWRCDLGWFYRPVFLSWFWLLLQAAGESPHVFHIANLMIHALNACLLGLLVYRLSRRPWAAAGSALVFVLLMRHNQAVWWVSAASTTLVSLFMLLALLTWDRYLRNWQSVWYAAALGACALALGAKEEAVVLIAALPLLELVLHGRGPRRGAWPAYLPFVLLTGLWLVLALRAHAAYLQGPADFMDYDARSYTQAVSLSALPERLPLVPGVVHHAWRGVLPLFPVNAAGLVGLGCLVACLWRDRAALWFVAWLGLLALPVSLTLSWAAMTGRFMYAPTLAATASGVLAIAVLDPRRSWTGRAILAAVAALLVPQDLRVMRDYYLQTLATDPALMTALINWATLACALGAAAWLWRAGRISAPELGMIALLSATAVLIALTPEDWEPVWWLVGMAGCAALIRSEDWWHGALSAFLLLSRAGTALPLFVAMLALLHRTD